MLSNKEEIMSQLPQANLHDMLCHAHRAERAAPKSKRSI